MGRNEKRKEQEIILQKCFGFSALQTNDILKKAKTDEDFIEIIDGAKDIFRKERKEWELRNFYGKFFTIKNEKILNEGSQNQVRKNILEALYSDPKRVQEILNLMIESNGSVDVVKIKNKIEKSKNALEALLAYDIVRKDVTKSGICYSLHEEIIPLVNEVLSTQMSKLKELPFLSSSTAIHELDEIKKMDNEYESYLLDMVENRLQEIINFGKGISISFLADYFKGLFGNVLYFDTLLSLTQQYALSDAVVINPQGKTAMQTGFNFAFFGAPGTGKTFSINDIIRGNPRKGVESHGISGRNRYCGGMTAAKFIRIGEAYQGRRFNFIVPEFNDWFKFRGMVEPLKLAMEQGEIRYEIKNETIGPYKFSSFFSTNYNTEVFEHGYKITVSDPNFNAIEDRMICVLHRMTKERYEEVAKSQKALALGKIIMDKTKQIRDHLTLIYAIETQHDLVKKEFQPKCILLTEDIYREIEDARNLILDNLKEKSIPFSARLERRAIQLACAMSLPNYFASKESQILIDSKALEFAIKFFVEEASIRTQEKLDAELLLKELKIKV